MSASFDPYHKWLGILPKDQPPHHYRLLGLEPLEDDLQVIEAAADRQLGFLRKFQSGEHAADCKKLLNEVARARLCLLKPATKADYDEKLREQLEGPAAPTIDFDPTLETSGPVRKSGGPGIVAWGSVALIVLSLVGGVAFLFSGKAEVDKPVPPEVAGSVTDAKLSDPTPDTTVTTTDSGKPTVVPKSEVTPDAKGQTNILPLLKSENILKGSWQIKPDRLESLTYNQHAQVALPITLPEEYTLHIRGTRLAHPNAPSQLCVVGLVCGDSNCLFVMEADPRNGGSGLENVDNMNWNRNSTTLPGFFTKIDEPFELEAIVRKKGIEIRIDGRTIVDWVGSYHRLKRPPGAWDVVGAKQLYLAAESKYVFTKITLGPPLPRKQLPGSDLKPGESVELLGFVDLKRDVWNGVWEKRGLTIKNKPDIPVSRFAVPYQVPDEYELVADIECEGEGRDFVLGVPFQSGHVGIGVGGRRGDANCLLIDYAAFFHEPHIAQQEAALVKGKNRVVVTVRLNHFIVKVNDRQLFDWKGDPRRYIQWPEYATPGQRVTIGTNGFSWQVNSLKLKRLAPAPNVFSRPAEPKDGNLLAIVDLDRDTMQGLWSKSAKGVESSPNNSTGLLFPAKLPNNYEFRVVAERKSGVESLLIAVPVAGRRVQLDFGFAKGMMSGIAWIEGKPADKNSAAIRHQEAPFPVGRPRVITGRVQGRHLKLDIDGQVLWDMDIPESLTDPVWMMRAGWLTPVERLQMLIATWEAGFELQEVRYRALDPHSPPFPKLNIAGKSDSGGDPSANRNPNRPLVREGLLNTGTTPVPDKAAQAAATQKLHELFKAEFANSKKDSEKLGLAHKLEKLAEETGNDPAAKFVCLDESRKLFAEVGDLAKAFALVEVIGTEFQADKLGLRLATLKSVGPKLKGPLLNRELIDLALPLIDELLAAEQYSDAVDLAALSAQSVIKVKDKGLSQLVQATRKETEDLAKEFATAAKARDTLQANPDDAAANLAWGAWVCLHQAKWEEGLKILQRSGNEKLKDLAARDLKDPQNKAEVLALGTDWLEFAKSRKDHSLAGFADRAEFWLAKALVEETGLAKTRIESLLIEAVATSDWNSPVTALLGLVAKKVSQRQYFLSEQITGGDGYDFQDIPPVGGVVVGFNCYMPTDDQQYINGVQAIYDTPAGIKTGEVQGRSRGKATEIRARRGYAVSSVTCQVETGVVSLQVTFSRMTKSGLDLKRSYTSLRVGRMSAVSPRTVSSGSLPVVGITGRTNDYLRGLGLVIAK